MTGDVIKCHMAEKGETKFTRAQVRNTRYTHWKGILPSRSPERRVSDMLSCLQVVPRIIISWHGLLVMQLLLSHPAPVCTLHHTLTTNPNKLMGSLSWTLLEMSFWSALDSLTVVNQYHVIIYTTAPAMDLHMVVFTFLKNVKFCDSDTKV